MNRPPAFNLADLFEIVADTVPGKTAVVAPHRRLTYGELEDRANRLAHVLRDVGVGAGDHIGLLLYNDTAYLEAMLAAFKLRAVPVNVNYRYLAGELRYLLDDAGARLVIHQPEMTSLVEEVRATLGGRLTSLAVGEAYEARLAGAAPGRDFPSRSADDRYVLYTGGTTGPPKGVVWRHEDIFFSAMSGGNPAGEPIEEPDDLRERARRGRVRMLPASPLAHGAAQWLALGTLLSGGTVVLAGGRTVVPERIWDTVQAHDVSLMLIIGDAIARPLLDTLQTHPDRWDLSCLSGVLSGGAILSGTLKDQFAELLPHAVVSDGYGASETGGQGQMLATPGRSGGPPRFRVTEETAVLDDDLQPVTAGSGAVGRVARRGRIPLGYHNDDARTAATFPVVDGVRWAIPGDFGTVAADGAIVLFGRGSVSINTGGEKVYPEEVEAVLKAHPSVFDAVVVGTPDERWGQRVTAVVQPRSADQPPTLEALQEHGRAHLAGYKLPRALVIVDAVRRSLSGKPDYRWASSVALGEA